MTWRPQDQVLVFDTGKEVWECHLELQPLYDFVSPISLATQPEWRRVIEMSELMILLVHSHKIAWSRGLSSVLYERKRYPVIQYRLCRSPSSSIRRLTGANF